MVDDSGLIQIVDSAMADAVRRSGAWVVCKPGCTGCCIGPFPITQLDALRLREGLAALAAQDPDRAIRVRERAHLSVGRMQSDYPGDLSTGMLGDDEESEERFNRLADDEPCPALDPETGTCDLYHARPLTCRTFGPAVMWGSDAMGACELCYEGATDEQIAECVVEIDPGELEAELVEEVGNQTGMRGQTIVAFALITASPTA